MSVQMLSAIRNPPMHDLLLCIIVNGKWYKLSKPIAWWDSTLYQGRLPVVGSVDFKMFRALVPEPLVS